MDVLTLFNTTRDDAPDPSPEAMTEARAALLAAAASEPPSAARDAQGAGNGMRLLWHRASAAVMTRLVNAMAGTGQSGGGSARSLWPRASAIATTAVVSAVVLTGAASIWIPQLWVGPEAEKVAGDLVLPVEYTTLSGESIRCTYAVHLSAASGRTDVEAALATLQSQDWTRFGEDVKQYALKYPFTESGPEWESADQAQREHIAFIQAAADIVIERANGLLPPDFTVSSTTDCSGRVS